jgi:hypothetical protein
MTTAGFQSISGGLGLGINGTLVQDWTSAGPVAIARSQQWVTAAVGSAGGATTALTFSTPATTPAALTGYLTYAQGTVNGDTWTINQAGLWAIKSILNVTGGGNAAQAYLSRNGTATLLPSTAGLTPAVALDYNTAGQIGTSFVTTGGTFALASGDVIRVSIAANGAATTIGAGNGGVCTVTFTFLGATATSL